ncbi:MAG TPA: glycosyltransferase family A protein [Blastocatellia bacterium]|nr:glycosyltransferase family A protein [Blastocatellia bacterium]
MFNAPGFDDAPLIDLIYGAPKTIQFVYPYYENPKFFQIQLDTWRSYPPTLRERIKVIVVDDGSPDSPAEYVLRGQEFPYQLRLFRIEVDVRWNWSAARNIGMRHAEEGWVVMTDMDHVIERDVAMRLTAGQHDPEMIYRFSRREHNGKKIRHHPNSMLMTREMFWLIGGYDEALAGYYGTDADWRRRCAKHTKVATLRDELVRYERFGDSSTTRYKRLQPEDAAVAQIISARNADWRPKTLSFPYHEVRCG